MGHINLIAAKLEIPIQTLLPLDTNNISSHNLDDDAQANVICHYEQLFQAQLKLIQELLKINLPRVNIPVN